MKQLVSQLSMEMRLKRLQVSSRTEKWTSRALSLSRLPDWVSPRVLSAHSSAVFQRKDILVPANKKKRLDWGFVIRLVFHNDHVDALNISVTWRLKKKMIFFHFLSFILISTRFYLSFPLARSTKLFFSLLFSLFSSHCLIYIEDRRSSRNIDLRVQISLFSSSILWCVSSHTSHTTEVGTLETHGNLGNIVSILIQTRK